MRGLVPKPLTDLHNSKCLELTYPDLLEKCETVFMNYFITVDMATNIEKHTRGQCHSKVWFQLTVACWSSHGFQVEGSSMYQ